MDENLKEKIAELKKQAVELANSGYIKSRGGKVVGFFDSLVEMFDSIEQVAVAEVDKFEKMERVYNTNPNGLNREELEQFRHEIKRNHELVMNTLQVNVDKVIVELKKYVDMKIDEGKDEDPEIVIISAKDKHEIDVKKVKEIFVKKD
jgi:hypothetical protein